MFDTKLQNFLDRHGACDDGKIRLQNLGVETLEQAWNQASDEDIIWAVTRHGVMSQEQKRSFLVMVLSSIEDKLTDMRSLNILTKLRTKETITSEDRDAACRAAACAEESAARAAWRAAESAARAAWRAAESAARAAWRAAESAARAAWRAAEESEESEAKARAAQAKWVRKNFKPSDLHTK